ncbi:Exportin-2 [Fasciola gigantica]|uniref:Exportin-2 n=1 Tax=Fasciola gigantica TaxID=46835 RepID=A0A504YZP5_FASGI|nr:Exportin-2 [Fasciola gigantica]
MVMESGFLTELIACLQGTLSADPNERKQAEAYIKTIETRHSYSTCLLRLVQDSSLPVPTRLAAAITFKNFVKNFWKNDIDGGNKISDGDRDQVRNQLIGSMLSVTGPLQQQLSEAIGIIWKEDFPHRWPTLIPDLVQRMAQLGADLSMVQGVLQTAHTLFKRYRHEFAGDDLFREMKTVISQFGAPLTELAKNLLALVIGEQRTTDPTRLVSVFQCLLLVCKIFLSLNCQDLPEYFEDHIEEWMAIFRSLLQIDQTVMQVVDGASVPGLANDGPRWAGGDLSGANSGSVLVEQVKSQVCDNASLYATKYEAEFAPYLSGFVTDVWEMLISTGIQSKYDMLIGNAIEFLSSVISRPQHRHLFESPDILQKLCEKVILPNMHFRALDEELFSDNPEEYLRLDLEGSDTHTRRRAACHLVHVLCQAFEGPVVANFSTYIEHLLNEYTSSPDGGNWVSKDAALLLVTSVAARGKTEKHGVTISTDLVNIPTFFEAHVLPELQNPNVNYLPVIKADCMRYAIAFRSLLPQPALVGLTNLAPHLLTATAPVVHSYAAALVDYLLAMERTDVSGEPVIKKEEVTQPQLLIERILTALVHPDSMDNVYLMRALMRVCCSLQELTLPCMNGLVTALLSRLTQVVKNPTKPNFNHYLFETICLCIRNTCAVDPSSVGLFEAALFPIFQDILQNDVSDFVPYVFQLISVLLERYPFSETVFDSCKSPQMTAAPRPTVASRPSPPYCALLPRLLVPSLWEQRGNVPVLSRLMQSYALHDMENVLTTNKLSAMLGVYQRLVGSSSHDVQGFALLGALIMSTPKQVLEPFLQQVFVVIFRRLQSSKTEKFMKAFVVFLARFILVLSPNYLINLVDGIQTQLFRRVLEKVLVPYTKVAISTLPYNLLGLGTSQTSCQLTYAVQPHPQLWPDHPDPRVFLAKTLSNVTGLYPNTLSSALNASLDSQMAVCLQEYLSRSAVTLH